MNAHPGKLILVYNAEDGLFNAVVDTVHRVFAPDTYQCYLCYYTYGVNGMLRQWKRFLESLDCPLAFFHRKEFRARYPRLAVALPAILIERHQGPEVLVAAEEITACGNLEELIRLTQRKWEAACRELKSRPPAQATPNQLAQDLTGGARR